VSTIRNWSVPTDWQTVCARAGGRRRYNAVRSLLKTLRRQQVLELLEAWGFGYGVQARIAATLNVHPSVVSRDIQALSPLVEACPACGSCVPRDRAREP
jgi:hypothetical protein